jgi:hypothetical protein
VWWVTWSSTPVVSNVLGFGRPTLGHFGSLFGCCIIFRTRNIAWTPKDSLGMFAKFNSCMRGAYSGFFLPCLCCHPDGCVRFTYAPSIAANDMAACLGLSEVCRSAL